MRGGRRVGYGLPRLIRENCDVADSLFAILEVECR